MIYRHFRERKFAAVAESRQFPDAEPAVGTYLDKSRRFPVSLHA